MHELNRMFWKQASDRYPRYFNDPATVIECGSLNINGSIREYFRCREYIGLDWRSGPCVDVVSLVHEAPFPPPLFDTVASASLLEHDPYWEKSLAKMCDVMQPDGMLVITWGAAMNGPHCFETAPDGQWHALKAGNVLSFMERTGIYVHEFRYEYSIYHKHPPKQLAKWETGLGEATLVAFKSPRHAMGERILDPLMDADRIDL